MRTFIIGLASAACLLGTPAVALEPTVDYPYWKLNYHRFDYTYASEQAKARRFAGFYWDAKFYCRYRSGWNGPGAYEIGTRYRRGRGWDGGYPWQGPGQPADHEDDEAYAEARALYGRTLYHAPVCGTRHVHIRIRTRHEVVLKRKD